MSQQQPTNGGNGRVARLQRESASPTLHDAALERDVLGACLLHPDLVMSSEVVASDFYSSANEITWSTLLRLVADGEPVDTSTLRAALHDAGRLTLVGGEEYLSGLTEGLPLRSVDTKRLRVLAQRRRLREAAQLVAAHAGAEDFGQYVARFESAKLELEALTTTRSVLPSMADVIESLRFDEKKLRTGLVTLDVAIRGGIPTGSLVVLVGAPGAAKTTFSVWLGDAFERQGADVLFLAADESRRSVVVRVGQLDGVAREAMESPMVQGRAAYAERWRKRPRRYCVVDPLRDELTLEEAARAHELQAGDRPRVIIVDSLQEVPCAAAYGLNDYDRINAVVRVCRHLVSRGAIVIALSEMSRAGYREQGANTSSMSASKGSSKIEYGAELLLTMRAVQDVPNAVDLEVTKSRIGNGEKPHFRVSLNREQASFSEVVPDDAEPLAKKQSDERDAHIKELILTTIRNHKDLSSKNDVVKASGLRRSDVFRNLAELLERGSVTRSGTTLVVVTQRNLEGL